MRPEFACERLLRGTWSSQGRGGHVKWDQNGPVGAAFLSSGTCAKVKAWQADPSGASLEEIVAVLTVAHEASHLAGTSDEAKAHLGQVGPHLTGRVVSGRPKVGHRCHGPLDR